MVQQEYWKSESIKTSVIFVQISAEKILIEIKMYCCCLFFFLFCFFVFVSVMMINISCQAEQNLRIYMYVKWVFPVKCMYNMSRQAAAYRKIEIFPFKKS